MLQKIVGFFFDTFGGQALASAALVATLFAWWQIERATLKNEGASHARHELDREAGALADKGREARDAVDRGDPHERLRRRWCVDCAAGGNR